MVYLQLNPSQPDMVYPQQNQYLIIVNLLQLTTGYLPLNPFQQGMVYPRLNHCQTPMSPSLQTMVYLQLNPSQPDMGYPQLSPYLIIVNPLQPTTGYLVQNPSQRATVYPLPNRYQPVTVYPQLTPWVQQDHLQAGRPVGTITIHMTTIATMITVVLKKTMKEQRPYLKDMVFLVPNLFLQDMECHAPNP